VTSLGFPALAILFILLPGFLAARVFQSVAVRPEQTEADKIVEALLFSFVIYVLYMLFFGGSIPVSLESNSNKGTEGWSVHVDQWRLLALAVLAILAGGLMGFVHANDISGKLLRRMRVTQRTTGASVWNDVFHQLGGIVQVELSDGRQVLGWLRYYSDRPECPSLFLERAHWVDGDNLIAVDGPGILLTRDSGIKNVMFLNYTV